MNIRYRVELSQTERAGLIALLAGGKHAVRKLKRAQILWAADAGVDDETIAKSVGVGGSTVYRTKRRFVEGNLEAALNEEPRPGGERKLTGKQEALLVATACSAPPKGRKRWTLELLAGEMVKLTEHDGLSRETIRRRLAENDLKPWRRDMWCIPEVDGIYVARMEDVLDLYAEGHDPKRPVVCFDESPHQLIGEVRQPIPAELGQPERYDCEYRRNGTVGGVLASCGPPCSSDGTIGSPSISYSLVSKPLNCLRANSLSRSVCRRIARARLRPLSSVLHPYRADLEGQQRVDVTRSPRSDERPLLRESNDWRHREGVVQTATATAASRRTIGVFWPGKIHAKPVARGSLALGQAKN